MPGTSPARSIRELTSSGITEEVGGRLHRFGVGIEVRRSQQLHQGHQRMSRRVLRARRGTPSLRKRRRSYAGFDGRGGVTVACRTRSPAALQVLPDCEVVHRDQPAVWGVRRSRVTVRAAAPARLCATTNVRATYSPVWSAEPVLRLRPRSASRKSAWSSSACATPEHGTNVHRSANCMECLSAHSWVWS